VRIDEITDVYIVPNGRAVGRRIICTVDVKMFGAAERNLGRALNKMRYLPFRVAGGAVRGDSCHIAIPQGDVGKIMSAGGVAKHPFGPQLTPAIGVERTRQQSLINGRHICGAVNCRRR